MLEQVTAILSEYTEGKEIWENAQLVGDLELTSFDLVAIVTDFEETFQIEIPDRDLSRFVCVSDILEYLEMRTGE